MILSLILACTGADPSPDSGAVADSGADSGADTDVTIDPELDFVGERTDAPVPLPSFAARNLDGADRGPDDLRGQPTVLWFYPAAGTYG
jgi:hypothetical protein